MESLKIQQSPNATRAGVGLIEVMIALFVFAASIAAMCDLAMIARQSSDRARDHYIAVNLAKNRLERAHSFGFGSLSMLEENKVLLDSTGVPNNSGDFRRTTTTTNVTPNLTEIRVTVEIRNRDTWTYAPGVENMRSYVANITGGS